MTEERVGEAYELDERLTVVGRRLEPGEQAPDFTLDELDADTGAVRQVELAGSAGRVRLLNVINSLDTPVCSVETRRWEDLALATGPDLELMTISMDLPFAFARLQETTHPAHRMLSSHRDTEFGESYGVLLKEWRLLQRAVFVIDGSGRIVHTEYVSDQMAEPDYRAAMAAVEAAIAQAAPASLAG